MYIYREHCYTLCEMCQAAAQPRMQREWVRNTQSELWKRERRERDRSSRDETVCMWMSRFIYSVHTLHSDNVLIFKAFLRSMRTIYSADSLIEPNAMWCSAEYHNFNSFWVLLVRAKYEPRKENDANCILNIVEETNEMQFDFAKFLLILLSYLSLHAVFHLKKKQNSSKILGELCFVKFFFFWVHKKHSIGRSVW